MVMNLNADPTILNPILSGDYNAAFVSSFIFETLIEYDNETLLYKPLLAESWDVSGDHKQFTFHLRKGVHWQDGQPFTANDVVYSFNAIMDPKVDAAGSRVSLRDVEKVEAPDDNTVRFTYARPYFRALLVCGTMPIVPKHIFGAAVDFNKDPHNRMPVGTGPYIFKEWKTKQKVVLEKNPKYWGGEAGINSLVFRIIEDSAVAFQELKKGEIDFSEISPIKWERSTDTKVFEEKFNKVQYYLPSFSFIGWNMRRPFFGDKRVRHAMTMMINKKDILAKLLFGHGVIVEGDQYYFGDAYDKSIVSDPFDPEKAAQLLDEAGWTDHDGDGIRDKDGLPFKFDFYSTSSNFATQLGSILREELLKVGVVVNLRPLEFNALIRAVSERDFDAVMMGWALPLDNDTYMVWHSSEGDKGSNFVGFANPEADKILDKVRVEFDRNRRNELFRALQKILHDEQPYTFLFNQATLLAYSKRFTNVKVYKTGVDIKEWKVK